MKQLQSVYIKLNDNKLIEIKQSEYRRQLQEASIKFHNIIEKFKRKEKKKCL